jgi:hypothetical protein
MTIKVYTPDGEIEEFPNAYAYWDWGDDETKLVSECGYSIRSMDRLMNSVCAFVHPGECEKIEITSEESDKVFKHEPGEGGISGKLFRIFLEISEERKRQDGKWGEQNHPMLDVPFTHGGMLSQADTYKKINDNGSNPSWFAILMEEVYEAFAETDPAKQRKEMIQVAAVAVQIIECLDRRMEEQNERAFV